MNKLSILYLLVFVDGAHAASFVPTSRHLVAAPFFFKPDVAAVFYHNAATVAVQSTTSSAASQDFDTSSSPTHKPSHYLVVQPSSVWPKKSAMLQAIECAQAKDPCDCDDPNELLLHLSTILQVDDECLFRQAFDCTPRNNNNNVNDECFDSTRDRKLIQRILQLKYELHGLQQQLKDNDRPLVNSVKTQYDREMQQHWYKDYLDFYHM